MPRLFVAIDLPSTVTEQLVTIQPKSLGGIRRTEPAQMHLTLHFLGETEIDRVCDAFRNIDVLPFTIAIAGVGSFTSRDGGMILWAGIQESRNLQTLHSILGEALTAHAFKLETRPLTPHITLARCKPGTSTMEVGRFLSQNANLMIREIPVMEFVLYSSTAVGHSRIYRVEKSFALNQ